MIAISVVVNEEEVVHQIDDRLTLADFIRDTLNLTGTHLACEHGVCGACTVLVNDEPIRSCITLAASVSGKHVRTIEAFNDDATVDVIRDCFSEAHGLQCGFCTPAMVLTVRDLIKRERCSSSAEIRSQLAGNVCRCTGYAGIVKATELAYARLKK
jgi:carbon-monoxide dehydrogenase small subunit